MTGPLRAGFEAKSAWLDRARNASEQPLNTASMLMLRAHAKRQIEGIRAQLREIRASTPMAAEDLEIESPEQAIPDPEIDADPQPQPLVLTDWPWAKQARALTAGRRPSDGSAP
jgi:hypothetical protein